MKNAVFIFVITLTFAIVASAQDKDEIQDSKEPILSIGLTGMNPKASEIDEESETLFIFKKPAIKGPLIKIEKKKSEKKERPVKIKPKKEKKIKEKRLKRKISEKQIRALEEALYENTVNEVLIDLGYKE